MSVSRIQPGLTSRPIGSESLRWTSWPIFDERPEAWLMTIFAIAVGVGTGVISHSLITGIFALVLLTVTLSRLWLPVSYEVGTLGIIEVVWKRRRCLAWRQIAGYRVFKNGVLIFHALDENAGSGLFGMYIPTTGHRDAILSVLKRYVGGELGRSATD